LSKDVGLEVIMQAVVSPGSFYFKGIKSIGNLENTYEIVDMLGRGMYGVVYLVTDKASGKKYALKLLNTKLHNESKIEELKREFNIIKYISAPDGCPPKVIVCYLEIFHCNYKGNNNLGMLMEYVQGTELEKMFDVDKGDLPTDDQMWTITIDILLALYYLHVKGVAHLDVKPQKMIYTTDNTVVLVDFGFACVMENVPSLETCEGSVGTPYYLSPELFTYMYNEFYRETKPKDYRPSDIWSAGILLGSLFSNVPLRDFNKELEETDAPIHSSPEETYKGIPPPRVELVRKGENMTRVANAINLMLTIDPNKRPTARQLLDLLLK
jgi:calcium-dependent protein kinase